MKWYLKRSQDVKLHATLETWINVNLWYDCWFQIPKIIIPMNHFAMFILHYNVGESRVDVISMSLAMCFPHRCHDSIHIIILAICHAISLPCAYHVSTTFLAYHHHIIILSTWHATCIWEVGEILGWRISRRLGNIEVGEIKEIQRNPRPFEK